MSRVIDCDMHLMEPREMWSSYADPGDRHLALRLDEDDQGHTWLWQGDRRLELAVQQVPGDTALVGEQVRRARAGEPATATYDEVTPTVYTDPEARLGFLDEQGLDATVLFPNYGLVFEGPLADDLDMVEVNMGAWNRYAGEVAAAGRGRLFPVGHVTIGDLDWLDRQLASLAAADVRLAMMAPSVVDGKRLSHPDHDRAWRSFVDHGISPVFHVGSFRKPFDEAWYADDPDTLNPVLSSVFLGTAAALALADLSAHGVFDRVPELRLGLMELSAVWVPLFMLQLDGGFEFHARFNGAPLTDLELKPSEYVRRQVRVAAFAYEQPDRLTHQAGDLFMMCSDFPHSEGTDQPRRDYETMCPSVGTPDRAPGLWGENVAWLLRED